MKKAFLFRAFVFSWLHLFSITLPRSHGDHREIRLFSVSSVTLWPDYVRVFVVAFGRRSGYSRTLRTDPHGLNNAQKFAAVVDAMSAGARPCSVASAATMCVT